MRHIHMRNNNKDYHINATATNNASRQLQIFVSKTIFYILLHIDFHIFILYPSYLRPFYTVYSVAV